jgi:predicted Rdx family selenoprotein
VGAASDLLNDYQHIIGELRLITGANGVFEVAVDGAPLFSKRAQGRHAKPGEVLQLFREKIAPGVEVYPRS